MKYSKKYSLMFGDMDVNYRMTKIALIKYFQETFARYCTKYNLAAFDVEKDNLIWVISDCRVGITGCMPFWSDEFEVEVWISEKTKLRTYVDFTISYQNEIIAKGDSCWFLLDINSRRPIKSIDIVEPLQICEEKVFQEHTKEMLEFQGTSFAEKKHTVTMRDLDFNFHVNNLSYINLAFETIPYEYLEKFEINSFSVRFLKEAHIDNILSCKIYKQDEKLLCKITDAKTSETICEMKACYIPKTDFRRNPREQYAQII